MAATLTDNTTHWVLANDYDTWYVEKTGIQMSNDYTDPWANIWAGFARKTGPNWTYHLVDEVSWTWTTDSGSGWVKLIGDTDFAGGKIVVHVEWTLEDGDKFLEVKWKMTNNFKDLDDSKMVVRNGQIGVNGATTDNWYRFYKTDDSLLDGQLPADAGPYNESTDSLQPQYRLIGNSKSIHWKWETTWDNNGSSSTTNVDVGCVNTNGKYGSNGYVYHEFNTGAWDKGTYKEVTMHWHDVETYFGASLNVFEMNGTNRNWTGDSGNTVKQLCPQGIILTSEHVVYSLANLLDERIAVKIAGGGQTVSSIYVQLSSWLSSPTSGSIKVGIMDDSSGSPSGSYRESGNAMGSLDATNITTTETWFEVSLTTATTLTKDTTYWVIIDVDTDKPDVAIEGFYSDDGNAYLTDGIYGEVHTNSWYTGYKASTDGGAWSALFTHGAFGVVLISSTPGDSAYGLWAPDGKYGTARNYFDQNAQSDFRPLIKNDETTLYRTVFQIKPLDDAWKATKDAIDDAYFAATATFTWAGFEQGNTAPDAKQFWASDWAGEGQNYMDIFNTDNPTGDDQDAEWNGTDTNIPQATTDSPPVQSGNWDYASSTQIDCYLVSGNNWETNGVGLTIDAQEWATWEWWFKVTDNFVAADTPEVEYHNEAGGGGVALNSCRFTFQIAAAEEEAFAGLGPFMVLASWVGACFSAILSRLGEYI
jgi:hypothetical protein